MKISVEYVGESTLQYDHERPMKEMCTGSLRSMAGHFLQLDFLTAQKVILNVHNLVLQLIKQYHHLYPQ